MQLTGPRALTQQFWGTGMCNLPRSGIELISHALAGRFLSTELPGKSLCSFFNSWNLTCEVAQSYPTLCDPMDCSLPGSTIHGIFQARILEWVAISFSRRSSQPKDWTRVSSIVGRRFTIWATRETLLSTCSKGTLLGPRIRLRRTWHLFFFFFEELTSQSREKTCAQMFSRCFVFRT